MISAVKRYIDTKQLNRNAAMQLITDEILMAYVDGELDDPELRDYIALRLSEYAERMEPFVFTRKLFALEKMGA
jgi:hypothetical protein